MPIGLMNRKKKERNQHFLTLTVLFSILLSRHVIVGRNFGSYVTHETKHFIYFYLGQVAVLLFKSG